MFKRKFLPGENNHKIAKHCSSSGFDRHPFIKTFKDENTEAVIKYEKRYLPGSVVEKGSDGNEWESTDGLTDTLAEIPSSESIIELEPKEEVQKLINVISAKSKMHRLQVVRI